MKLRYPDSAAVRYMHMAPV